MLHFFCCSEGALSVLLDKAPVMMRTGPVKIYAQNCLQAPAEGPVKIYAQNYLQAPAE